jgi:hypothetical protein
MFNFIKHIKLLKHTVPTGEVGTQYQLRPVFTWRLMALRNFSLYFFISNLVAVVL